MTLRTTPDDGLATGIPEAKEQGRDIWLTLPVERALYVDFGRITIFCDPLFPTPATLIVRMTPEQRAAAMTSLGRSA